MNNKEYKKEVSYLLKCLKAYEEGKELISDKEYDLRIRRLRTYESTHPEDIIPTSPSIVISTSNIKDRYEHLYPMYSMRDAFDKKEVSKWLSITSCKEYITLPKFDGMSLNIVFKDGKVVMSATRGDGTSGEIVTSKIPYIKNIPNEIKFKGTVEIRGEVCMPREIFNRLNDSGYAYKHPRGAVAGAMTLKDLDEFKKRGLVFLPWDMKAENLEYTTYEEVLDAIWNMGFKRYDKAVVTTLDEIQKKYEYYDTRQDAFKIDYDGLVIRVNNLEEFKDLGVAGKYPKGILAYKFSTEEKTSIIKSIIVQVGRTGAIIPVAEIEPVELCGTTVQRAFIHNWRRVSEWGITVGSKVLVTKSGGVIPKILTVLESNGKPYVKPVRCPMCLSKLLDDGVNLFCINDDCVTRNIRKIIYFASRERMDINGLGPAMVNVLFEKGLVKNFDDLYHLDKSDLETIDLGDKTIDNLLEAIEHSKGVTMQKLLGSLGIPIAGERVWNKVLPNIVDLFNMDMAELTNIPGIGSEISGSILSYFKANEKLIKSLIVATEVKDKEVLSLEFKDKVFYITGTLDTPRKVIKEYIEDRGGVISKTLNKNITDFLAGKGAMEHKLVKATELGLNIIYKL